MIIGAVVAIPLAMWVRERRRCLDGPDTFECSWRVTYGRVPGLVSRWRHGQAHMDGERLLWRRLPWWWQQVRLVPARVEPVVDRHRGPLEAIFVASDAVIVRSPCALGSGWRWRCCRPTWTAPSRNFAN